MANEVTIIIKGDNSHAKGQMAELRSMAPGIGDAIKGAALVGGAALTAAFAGAITAAAGFEKRMSGVKAVSGASSAEMAQLSKLALQLGKDTSFTASEAAKGIEELVKGGISVADIMGGAARASLNLAAAGEIDLASAAEIAANAMNQFGLKGTDMAKVSDLIAGAANASSLGVNDFKLSLSQVGAVASVAGQSFDSTAQAIAVMGAAGIKGSDAGTSLKTMLLNLQPATKAARAAFAELGITTTDGANQFFDAAGKAKSMRDISEVLRVSMAGLTDQQRLAKLEIMFGSDAMRSSAILAKAGAEGFDKMAAAMGKVTAAEVAKERLNNVAGSLEQLKGSLETAAITATSVFLPSLKGLIDQATAGVNAIIPWIEKTLESGDAAGEAGKMIKAGLGLALTWIGDQLPVLAQKLGEWANEMVDWIIRAVPQLITNATTFLGNLLGWLTEHAPVLAEKLIGEWVPAAVAWVAESAVKILKELPGWIIQIGRWLIDEGIPKMEEFGNKLGEGIGRGIKAAIDRWGPDLMKLISRYASPQGAVQAAIDLAAGGSTSSGIRKLEGFSTQDLGISSSPGITNPNAPDWFNIGAKGVPKMGDFSSQWWVNEIGMNPYQYTLGGALQQLTAEEQAARNRQASRVEALQRQQAEQAYKSALLQRFGTESEGEIAQRFGGFSRDAEGGVEYSPMVLRLLQQIRDSIGLRVDGVELQRAGNRQAMVRGLAYGAMGGGY